VEAVAFLFRPPFEDCRSPLVAHIGGDYMANAFVVVALIVEFDELPGLSGGPLLLRQEPPLSRRFLV
jgi:hypothetical protein